jgi:hypothetical protein
VEEITYRQSRLCRLLGNPVAFAVVALLTNGKDLSTSNGIMRQYTGGFRPECQNARLLPLILEVVP